MSKQAIIKEILINNTISLIAEGGFEKATTKAIAHNYAVPDGIKMNEVYIYRHYLSKEGLYAKAFATLAEEVFGALSKCMDSVGDITVDTNDKLKVIFDHAWGFLLRNEAHCRCYVRFYYSIYLRGATLANHKAMFRNIADRFSPIFKDEADVEAIMHSVFNALLDFAIRVYNGELVDDEVNRPHIYNLVYNMMCTYFKAEIPCCSPLSR